MKCEIHCVFSIQMVGYLRKPRCLSFLKCEMGHNTFWKVFDETIFLQIVVHMASVQYKPNLLLQRYFLFTSDPLVFFIRSWALIIFFCQIRKMSSLVVSVWSTASTLEVPGIRLLLSEEVSRKRLERVSGQWLCVQLYYSETPSKLSAFPHVKGLSWQNDSKYCSRQRFRTSVCLLVWGWYAMLILSFVLFILNKDLQSWLKKLGLYLNRCFVGIHDAYKSSS